MMDDETKLKLVKWWMKKGKNYYRGENAVPEELKGKITVEEAMDFQKIYRESGKLTNTRLIELESDLSNRIVIKESNKNRILRELIIGILIVVIGTVIAYFLISYFKIV
ncbi:hypothetical protein BEH94_04215 [Candidatus Altiarchaeales archaeon WOR_SM1_SCG]|nr:hypothetical protein BEH94_04215 [Candidatus Altiarchaeales archaeon WOR_SM1_SCG]